MKDKDLTQMVNHHIVPDYICKELGLTTSYKVRCGKNKRLVEFYFKENHVLVTRLKHAEIHWGYYTSDLSLLLEVCSPEYHILDMIPLGDKRDLWAAKTIGMSELDISGENNHRYGKTHSDEAKANLAKQMKQRWADGVFDDRDLTGDNNPMWGKNFNTPEEIEKKRKEVSINTSGEKNGMYGKTHSDECKKKMSEDRTGEGNHQWGKKYSEEELDKRWRGKNNPMYGKEVSADRRRKTSISFKAKWADPVWKKKMLESRNRKKEERMSAPDYVPRVSPLKGKKAGPMSAEVKQKISETKKALNLRWSDETRQKTMEGRLRKKLEKATATLDNFL